MIKDRLKEILPTVIKIRRELHMYPELSDEEYETQERIAGYLDSWGISYERNIAKTGIVATIYGKKPGKTVAARADIDALPIMEENELEYKSKRPGIMHACGHDVHTAINLGVAKFFKEIEEDLEGNVKLFFQPAEETIGGAKRMIDEGFLEDPRVDYVIALHVTPHFEVGEIQVRKGMVNAATNELSIKVKGRSGHAAYPEDSVDAILISANIITALQSLVSRNISPLNPLVLSLGKIKGGVKNNVIADEVVISGTLRTLDEKTRKFAKDKIRDICEKTALVYGGCAEVEFFEEGAFAPLENNSDLVDSLVEVASEVIGRENIYFKDKPSMGGDDFSFFTKERPGVYYFLGTGNKEKGCNFPAHNGKFKVDEDGIEVGLELQVRSILKFLKS